MISDVFYKFCVQHSCREDCKNRSDYCPIADKVRSKHGGCPGGEKCQAVFMQQSNHPSGMKKLPLLKENKLPEDDINNPKNIDVQKALLEQRSKLARKRGGRSRTKAYHLIRAGAKQKGCKP